MQGKADAPCKARQMRDTRQGKCAMQGWSIARSIIGHIREAKPGSCASQGRMDLDGGLRTFVTFTGK
jgi:hypothetical protein